LTAGGEAVDPELAICRVARGVVALGEDAISTAVLAITPPHHDEVAVGVHGHGRLLLTVRREAVDLELATCRVARGVVALGEDAVPVAVLAVALPRHDEVAVGVHGHGRDHLNACREAVDLERGSLRIARGIVALGEDAVLAAVLAVAVPRHDEVAVGVHGHGRSALLVYGEAVDLEFAAQGVAGCRAGRLRRRQHGRRQQGERQG
jgi:hypothetical protein